MGEPVRWGILSTANIGRRVIPAIHASHNGVVAAVGSRSPTWPSSTNCWGRHGKRGTSLAPSINDGEGQ